MGNTQQHFISLKGVRVNNLKNINLDIPRGKFVVISGLSGSGKSSLARDTIYAEGQRRYVESLSSYARQFLGRMNKPEVDIIQGIPPAIAVEQKVNTHNPRSTVGTSTEIYDYLKLLFARIGITYSPISGQIVKKETVTDVINWMREAKDSSFIIMYPLQFSSQILLEEKLNILSSEGISRIEINGEIIKIDYILESGEFPNKDDKVNIILDRVRMNEDKDTLARIGDSVQTAFKEGLGFCEVKIANGQSRIFSSKFEKDGIIFEEATEHLFSFNNPYGACPICGGAGWVNGIDEDLVIPDKSLSVYDGTVACWRGEVMQKYQQELIYNASRFGFPIHRPYSELSDNERSVLWNGNQYFTGIMPFFNYLDEKKYKIQNRVLTARYTGKTICRECGGARLRKQAGYVKVNGKTISDIVMMPIDQLLKWFDEWNPSTIELNIAGRLITEIKSRLQFLEQVGLGYLTLNRLSSSLSGGEAQRINLATSLGSSLVGSLYILDEPSIGLHPKDTHKLIQVLLKLRDLGNTVIVVEHDEDIIRSADQLIDIGPYAGRYGGEVVFQGSPKELINADKSYTAAYLSGKMSIASPLHYRKWHNSIKISGAKENNLKNIEAVFPLNVFCVVTGVSGSGKTTLVHDVLYKALARKLNDIGENPGRFNAMTGDISSLSFVEYIDQSPLGRSSRSNPVTYSKAYDDIRKLFADTAMAKRNNFKASDFSFNVDGGRCEECQGEGVIHVPMQFMADVVLECEFCHGKKFKDDVLEVTYNQKNIFDILEMTVSEAIEFFSQSKGSTEKRIVNKLQPLQDVGLGYVKLGQSSATLSGGESQRVKLASFLGTDNSKSRPILFIFDEPTTGLHFHDINNLLKSFSALIEHGHSVIVIEHNLDVIKNADWVIDMGLEGGENGGQIIAQGTPMDIVNSPISYTGKYLASKI